MKLLIFTLLFGAALATKDIQIPYGNETAHYLKYLSQNFDSFTEDEQIGNVNQLTDMILQEVRNLMINQGLDPMQIPDIHEGFEFKIIIITYHGELDLTKGWLQDVSTLYRGGDVKVDYSNRVLTTETPLSFNDFIFQFKYSAKLMGLGPTGDVEGKVTDIRVSTNLKIDFANLHVTLTNFKLEKTGKITVKFHGNGIIDWIINILSDVTTTIFKGLIKTIAQIIVGNTLQAVVDAINKILGTA